MIVKEYYDSILDGWFKTLSDEEFLLLTWYGIQPTKGIVGFLNFAEEMKKHFKYPIVTSYLPITEVGPIIK